MNFEKLLGQEVFTNHNRNPFQSSDRFVHPCLFMCLPCYLHLFYRFKRLFLCFTWSEMSSVSSTHPRPLPPPPSPNGRQCDRDSRDKGFNCSPACMSLQCLNTLLLFNVQNSYSFKFSSCCQDIFLDNKTIIRD